MHPAQAQPVAPAVLHRLTEHPARVRLTWSGDPATTQSVTWVTSDTVTETLAQITEARPGPDLETGATLIQGVVERVTSDLGWTTLYHTVRFEKLKPKTRYAYRVGDGANWSEWFQFTTAAPAFEPFSFIYLGDAQNGINTLWPRVFREAFTEESRARFFLFAGDLVNRANMEAEWAQLYDGAGWVNAQVPTIATPGNHEYWRDAEEVRRLSDHWRPHFELPLNGPKGLEETCYYLDYQGVRVISLNSNVELETQTEWLDKTLSNNPNRWTIVTFHHPVFSAAKDRDNPQVRALWKPIFDKHRVDLVLQGHDHTYGRSDLDSVKSEPTPGVQADGGTVYVVSVSGSKMYDLQELPWMVRRAEDTQLYQIIRVFEDRLEYSAKTANGQLYDAFSLFKRAGKTNRLVDQKPNTPERRRPPSS